MLINEVELRKPIIKTADGKFITLKEVLDGRIDRRLISESMKKFGTLEESSKELVVERYRTEPRNKILHILGGVDLSIGDIIFEVLKGSDVGKEIILREKMWIQFLLSEFVKGNLGKKMMRGGGDIST